MHGARAGGERFGLDLGAAKGRDARPQGESRAFGRERTPHGAAPRPSAPELDCRIRRTELVGAPSVHMAEAPICGPASDPLITGGNFSVPAVEADFPQKSRNVPHTPYRCVLKPNIRAMYQHTTNSHTHPTPSASHPLIHSIPFTHVRSAPLPSRGTARHSRGSERSPLRARRATARRCSSRSR